MLFVYEYTSFNEKSDEPEDQRARVAAVRRLVRLEHPDDERLKLDVRVAGVVDVPHVVHRLHLHGADLVLLEAPPRKYPGVVAVPICADATTAALVLGVTTAGGRLRDRVREEHLEELARALDDIVLVLHVEDLHVGEDLVCLGGDARPDAADGHRQGVERGRAQVAELVRALELRARRGGRDGRGVRAELRLLRGRDGRQARAVRVVEARVHVDIPLRRVEVPGEVVRYPVLQKVRVVGREVPQRAGRGDARRRDKAQGVEELEAVHKDARGEARHELGALPREGRDEAQHVDVAVEVEREGRPPREALHDEGHELRRVAAEGVRRRRELVAPRERGVQRPEARGDDAERVVDALELRLRVEDERPLDEERHDPLDAPGAALRGELGPHGGRRGR